MKTKILIVALALGASTWLVTAQDGNQRPDGQRPPGRDGGPGGPGGPGGFHLLPPHVQDQLNLSEAQQKELAVLEAEIKAKIEKILTPAQVQQMKQMGPPRRAGGPGGQGGPGGEKRRGGPGGPGGPEGEGRPQRPPQDQ